MDVETVQIIELGRLSLAFGQVNRKTFLPDGVTPESDTDHTVMLGLVACALADRWRLGLDVGLIARYALVHDLPEVYAGDTPTLRLPSEAEALGKADREAAAAARIAESLSRLPWVIRHIASYEARGLPEARFVRAVDKLLPKITHVLNYGAAVRAQGMTRQEVADRYRVQRMELDEYAGDFPRLLSLYDELVELELRCLA